MTAPPASEGEGEGEEKNSQPPTAAALFHQGREKGLDPTNTAEDGVARTTVNSAWVVQGRQACDVCRHSFRVGDIVKVVRHYDGTTLVRHHSSQLPCTNEIAETETTDEDLAQRFFAAVDEQNPMREGEIASRLRPGHWMVADHLPVRSRCAGCGHTLRPFEVIVMCPCDFRDPKCKLPVHHDPAHGVNCLEDWLLSNRTRDQLHHCPMSFRKLHGT